MSTLLSVMNIGDNYKVVHFSFLVTPLTEQFCFVTGSVNQALDRGNTI